jgi:hypothetical protein
MGSVWSVYTQKHRNCGALRWAACLPSVLLIRMRGHECRVWTWQRNRLVQDGLLRNLFGDRDIFRGTDDTSVMADIAAKEDEGRRSCHPRNSHELGTGQY